MRRLAQIANVVLGRGGIPGIADVVGVGRADDRPVEPRQDEEQPAVLLREEHMRLLGRVRRHEVDAFGEPQQRLRAIAERLERAIEPGTGRVHGEASADLDALPAQTVAHHRPGHRVAVAEVRHRFGMVEHDRAVLGRVDDVLDDEPLDEWDLGVVEAPRAGEPLRCEVGLGGERRIAVEVLALREALVERERVVELHPDAQLELVPKARAIQRQEEREWEHQMRRDAEQDLSLAHVAADEAEVEELEVTEAPVDQPGGTRARAGREVVLFDQRDAEAAESGVARDPRADDPAPDDEEIGGAAGERPHRLVSCA